MRNESYLKKIKPVTVGSAMADIALLLLIFFMTATTADPPKAADVNLPAAQTQSSDSETIYIAMTKDGQLYYEGEAVTPDGLKEKLELRQYDRDKTVTISADRSLPYQEVGALLSLLQDIDFLNVVFMAQPRKQEGHGEGR